MINAGYAFILTHPKHAYNYGAVVTLPVLLTQYLFILTITYLALLAFNDKDVAKPKQPE
jgi:hypothetical protein